MRLATMAQIKTAARNVCDAATWNNTDANFLINQKYLIEERLRNLQQPSTDKRSAWDRYDERRTALCEKFDICDNPHRVKVANV